MNLTKQILESLPIEAAGPMDAEAILSLQKRAYFAEAELNHNPNIEPMVQDIDSKRSELQSQRFLKVSYEGEIIGSVKAFQTGATCFIGKLIVHPGFQNLGLGRRLLQAIEDAFSDAGRFELFTGCLSQKNILFYLKSGYRLFEPDASTQDGPLVFLEKQNLS